MTPKDEVIVVFLELGSIVVAVLFILVQFNRLFNIPLMMIKSLLDIKTLSSFIGIYHPIVMIELISTNKFVI